jgi:glycosyltransferase involved in cell wall biosynthesis
MAKIKVLHIITRLIVGGAQENTMYTADLLDKNRYQIDVISGPQTGSEGSLIDELLARNIQLRILPYLVREINPIKDLITIVEILKHIRRNQYSIIHTHSSKAGILGRIAAYLAGATLIVHTVHGWSFHDHMPRFTRRIYIFLEQVTARISDALIVVSNRDADQGKKYNIMPSGEYHLIRSAIPQDEFYECSLDRHLVRSDLGIPEDAPVLGNVGRFSVQKNPLEWVKVAALVKQAVPNCFFLLVGDGPLRSQVDSLLQESGLLQYTIMTGLRRDIPQLLSAMDVFLLTSLWEGLPRVIPEAMLVGVPVVSSSVDGSAEIILDGITGYTCQPGDIHSFANRCIELLIDSEKRNRISKAARCYASQTYDLKHMVTQIDQLYMDLLIKHGKH